MRRKSYTSVVVLFALLFQLLPPSTGLSPQQENVSGHFNLAFVDSMGVSNYTIYYSYPRKVESGSNFTLQTTVFVNRLSGLKLYLTNYVLVFTLVTQGRALMQTVRDTSGRFLYEGAHWGPLTTTFPIQLDEVVGSRESPNATLAIRFVATVWYEIIPPCPFCPLNWPEGDERSVGTVLILPQSNRSFLPGTLQIAASVAVAAVLVFSIIVWKMKKR